CTSSRRSPSRTGRPMARVGETARDRPRTTDRARRTRGPIHLLPAEPLSGSLGPWLPGLGHLRGCLVREDVLHDEGVADELVVRGQALRVALDVEELLGE